MRLGRECGWYCGAPSYISPGASYLLFALLQSTDKFAKAYFGAILYKLAQSPAYASRRPNFEENCELPTHIVCVYCFYEKSK